MELYPSLKPLPTPEKMKRKAIVPRGTVTVEDYERRQFQQAFKKEKPKQ